MSTLLLVRHGEAVDKAPGGDGDRWLTPHGRAITRAVAARLATLQAPGTVWTSPLVRAVQTAEILTAAVGHDVVHGVLRELASGDVAGVVQHAMDFDGTGPLCLVGHEPTLSSVVLSLLGRAGMKAKHWNGFGKSDVCCLSHTGKAVHFEWMLRARDLSVVRELEALRK